MNRKRWLSLSLRVVLALLALVLILLAAAWIALPGWIKGSGARIATEALGREVRINEVHFQPWRLGLVVEGVSIAGAKGETAPLLNVGRIDAAVSLRSIWHFSPVLSSLTVEKPIIHLARTGDGHYDIDDLIERFNKPSAKPEPAKTNQPDFALYNIRLSGGEIHFDDRPVHREHLVSALSFELPFISTLDTDEKVDVLPFLTGKFNGVEFGGKGDALPFAEPPEASLEFKLAKLDLTPYLPYVPESLPLKLQKGSVEAQMKLRFAKAQVQLSGQVGLSDFALQTRAGQPWLAWKDLQIALKDVRPLHHQLQLGAIRWDGLELDLRRDAAGKIFLPTGDAPAKPDAKAETKTSPAWTFGLDSFALNGAVMQWQDAASHPQANLRAEAVNLKLGALQWPLKNAATLSYAMKLQGAALSGEGSLAPDLLRLTSNLQDLPLEGFAAYVPASAPLKLKGSLKAQAEIKLAQPLDADPAARLNIALHDVALNDLALADSHGLPLVALAALNLDEAGLDLGAQHVHLGKLALHKPVVQLARDKQGQWRHAPLVPAPSHAPATHVAAAASKPWAIDLAALTLDGGALRLRDASLGDDDGLNVDVDALKIQLQNVTWPQTGKPVPVSLSLIVAAPQAKANARGTVNWQGQLSLANEMSASGRLRLDNLPLQLFDELLDPAWGLRLRRAELGWRGSFEAQQQAAGWRANASGDLLLADLRLAQLSLVDGKRVTGDNLLTWQALNLDGMKVGMQPGAAPSVNITKARLDDFYASLLINEQGKLNLKQIGPQEVAAAPSAASASASASAPAASAVPASAASAASAAPAPPAASAPAPMHIAIQSTELSKGKVDFTDHFVRPNYSAQLTALTGSLGAFASDKPATAALQLHGQVAGTGLLEVGGQINPGASPPELDITASATDIELAPFSPYSGKYAGYAIERGKLSTKVHYKIEQGGQLQAENQVTLNQLTFGDAVDSPDATHLPVRFAVALLKDRDGVIDINLPISGSINDPQFSFGGLIVKAIVNLLGKALTSPFSLFTGGGGADLSHIAFAPGSSTPTDPAQIDKIAKLLNERPALKLTISGWADLAHEREALQQRSLDDAIATERRRELRRQQTAGADAQAQAPLSAADLSDADRARLLKVVYGNAKLPKKPRNLIGLEKDIPASEMRALLLPSYAVDAQRIHDLALQRSVVLRDALIAKGVPNSRIFLGAPHAGGEVPADWQAHADMALGAD
ncbi:MAG TPA: DUF748 domain-containing protein [Burkholderiaceae bacterium]|jgi:uncharacterized protein involved in outer membrane biogenesis